jgi:hypothetical protein
MPFPFLYRSDRPQTKTRHLVWGRFRSTNGTTLSKALFERMLNKIDELCVERDRLKKERGPVKGRICHLYLVDRIVVLVGAGIV